MPAVPDNPDLKEYPFMPTLGTEEMVAALAGGMPPGWTALPTPEQLAWMQAWVDNNARK